MCFRSVLVCLLLLQWSNSGGCRTLQRIDRTMSKAVAVKEGEEPISKQEREGLTPKQEEEEELITKQQGEGLMAKLLVKENEVMEPKRKRSFPGNNTPLDRLSLSSMETKQGTNKHSKVVELPRRRVNPAPLDRIGTSRLPNRG